MQSNLNQSRLEGKPATTLRQICSDSAYISNCTDKTFTLKYRSCRWAHTRLSLTYSESINKSKALTICFLNLLLTKRYEYTIICQSLKQTDHFPQEKGDVRYFTAPVKGDADSALLRIWQQCSCEVEGVLFGALGLGCERLMNFLHKECYVTGSWHTSKTWIGMKLSCSCCLDTKSKVCRHKKKHESSKTPQGDFL